MSAGCIGARAQPERGCARIRAANSHFTTFIAAWRSTAYCSQQPIPLLARRMLLSIGSTYPTHSDPLGIRALAADDAGHAPGSDVLKADGAMA